MNETIQTLINRRSIRSYTNQQISDEDLQLILKAGEYAATGKSMQPVAMVVVQDKDTIAQLSAMNAKILGSDADPMYGAPTIIVVLSDPQISPVNYWSDGCLVMGNLMNAAASLGLGSCWINRAKEEFESPEGKALLKKWGLPQHLVGVGHCIIGYAAQPAKPAKPRKADFIKYVR